MTLLKIQTWLLALFAVALVFSISGALIIGGVLLVLGVVLVVKNHRPWQPHPLDLSVGLFFVWGVLCAVVQNSMGFFHALSTQSAILLFFIFAHTISKKNIPPFMMWLLIAMSVAGLWAVVQKISGSDMKYFSLWNGRAVGTRSHPLTFAETFIPGVFLGLGVLLKRRGKPLLLVSGMGLMFLGVLLAQGRGVWLGLATGLVVTFFFIPRRWAIWGFTLFLVGSVLLLTAAPAVRGRLFSSFSKTAGTMGDQHSKEERYFMWEEALRYIRKTPVIGQGLRGAKLNVWNPALQKMEIRTEAHNTFLQLALETGLVGFGLWLWILLIAVGQMKRLPFPWKATALGCLSAFMVAGITESWTGDKEVFMLFWVFLGSLSFAYDPES